MSENKQIMEIWEERYKTLTPAELDIYSYCVETLENNKDFVDYAHAWNKSDMDAYCDNMYAHINYKMCLLRDCKRLKKLNILDSQPKFVILDIGCGTGYFSYFSKLHGHVVYSLDAPLDTCGYEIFTQGQRLFNLEMCYHTIEQFKLLPACPRQPNLAVAFSPHFYLPADPDNFWKEPQWRFFLKDLSQRLAPDAKIYFEMNDVTSQPDYGVFGTKATKNMFETISNIENGYKITILNRSLQNTL